ncbi:MAG TPA: hypothetical protein VH082_04705 [Rudaea sp.]|jgi:hypothetical protein|nr:hypothetical protein [Rudaea sp.]
MKKYTFALLLIAASVAHADGDIRKAGTVRIDSGDVRASTVHIGCSSDPHGGALVVEIIVPDAYTKKDFGYEDFEGPDAPAGKLSHIEWIAGAKTSQITTAIAGGYIPEPPDAFNFEIAGISRRASSAATLLAGVEASEAKLVWTQSSYDKSKRTLVATFAFDASESAHVRDVVKACLPPAK